MSLHTDKTHPAEMHPDDMHPNGALAVVGTGPGEGYLTPRAEALMLSCDDFVGGAAALELAPNRGQHLVVRGELSPLLDQIEGLLESGRRVCVLTSGDPGYFSLLAALERRFPGLTTVEPGISSVQVLASRLRLPWQEFRHFSVHGRDLSFEAPLDLPFTVLCSPGHGPDAVAAYLREHGFAGRAVVGVSLGRPDEEVVVADLGGLVGRRFDGPAILLFAPAEWLAERGLRLEPVSIPDAAPVPVPVPVPISPEERPSAHSRPPVEESPASAPPILERGPSTMAITPARDEEFARGEAPLSRWEARIMLAAVASPAGRTTIWEVGAGSGGYTVTLAQQAPGALLVAFEKNPRALAVLEQNLERFGVSAEVVPQEAPDGFDTRPSGERPDLVVIGGSGGRFEEMLHHLEERMAPGGRLVCTAVTIDTLSKAAMGLRRHPWRNLEVMQQTVVRTDERGILRAQNPVTFLSADFEGSATA